MRPQLIIAVDKQHDFMCLREGLARCPEITILALPANKLSTLTDLDALFLPLPAAERWGARPLLHKAQILSAQGADGKSAVDMPPYVVTGVAMAADDPHEPAFELELMVISVLEAVQAFNTKHPGAIQVIGFWGGNLCMDQLGPEQAGKIIRAAYEKTLSTLEPC
jgi:hypothetical protein